MKWSDLNINSLNSNGTVETFSKAVSIWVNRPNVCNKLISCCIVSELNQTEIKCNPNENSLPQETLTFVKTDVFEKLKEVKSTCGKSLINSKDYLGINFIIRKLVPRRPDCYKNSHELVISFPDLIIFVPITETYMIANNGMLYLLYFHFCEKCASTISACSLNYKTTTDSDEIETVNVSKLKDCWPTEKWIKNKLLPTIIKWSNEEILKQTEKSQKPSISFPPSLSLIDAEVYTKMYNHLKKKYGLELAKVWPEVTDPQKYVYEDVAIASYLITLWQQEREDKSITKQQSFVDLGCGNGLLVYILNSEGHPGMGLDIRKRKIWDLFEDKANLKESVVTPENLETIKGYDWLLGNHSDELTPWIPVMALRSSYNTRFWVLPCCFFDFYGKYERKKSLHGQYWDYLDFVEQVGKICGFDMKQDVMRIPSTKRVCFVGMERKYEESDHLKKLQDVEHFIESRKHVDCVFTSRPKEEKIKNCTKLDKGIRTEIVKTIVSKLLETTNIEICNSDTKSWNKGGKITISEAALLFDDQQRSKLKSECGGLQTLLRNYHQVFEVKNSRVKIRNWCDLNEPIVKKRKVIKGDFKKTKPCWFYSNHPDGCPRASSECSFAHENDLIVLSRAKNKIF